MISRRTVFIVDDHIGNRRRLGEILRPHGFTIVGESGDGDEALLKIEALQPNACLIDLTLRNGDVLRMLAQLRRHCPQTVTFVTAMPSQARMAMEALTMGAADILLRPYGSRTVVNILSQHLR